VPNHAGTETAKECLEETRATVGRSNARASGPFRPRFTIRSLMIIVAVVAALLAPLKGWIGLAITLVLAMPLFAHLGVSWLVFRGERRVAALAFWGAATLINVVYAVLCMRPNRDLVMPLCLIWLFFIAPTLISCGVAWGFLATRPSAIPRRPALPVWLAVALLTVMPVLAPLTFWPRHLTSVPMWPKKSLSGRPSTLYDGPVTDRSKASAWNRT
jgi:hypothetical protein